jgi:putative ABC transport system permease protein
MVYGPSLKQRNMFRNYLKTAWRNLVKNRIFSLINILGLAIGLCCFLLIAMYVLDELSFDRHHKKADRIYRISSEIKFGGSELDLPVTSDIMGAVLKSDYPQVEEFTRIYASSGSKLIKKGNEYINEESVVHADSTLFDVFTFPSIAGDTKTALNEPNTVVITEAAARKYFGTTDAVGKLLETNDNNSTLYKVTAVIRNMPKNSHFTADFLFSMDNVDYPWGTYLSHNFHTYLLLQEGTDPRAFEKNFDEYIEKYIMPQAKSMMQIESMEAFEKAGNKLVYSLIPVRKIHLYSNRPFELSPSGNIQYVYIFSAVAIMILLIACFNFMNLTTARSANRSREVGIRKVLGTERQHLILQFLTECTLMVFVALIIAIGIGIAILPLFNDLSSKTLEASMFFSPTLLPLLIALPFVVGLLAGSYPAFFMSAFKPIEVLKGKLQSGSRKASLRSVLVVLQFSISIILITGTIIIYRQLNYIQTKNLGYQKDQVLIINDTYALNNNTTAFKNELLSIPGIKSGTLSGFLPVASARNDNSFFKDATIDSKSGFNMQSWLIDYDYMKTLGMEMLKGRNFSREFGADSSFIILNETAAKLLGYDDPIGKKIYTFADQAGTQVISYDIIGVVKNFHFESLRQDIGPLSFRLGTSTYLSAYKVDAANIPSILKQVESKWKTMAPGMPFSYRFMDDSFDDLYRTEQRVGSLALIFSILAIVIACLGLFGLATFIAEQRTKEIGIRKVLGSSVTGIVQLLSTDFLKLVAIAFILAVPIAWYAMHRWLEDFAYRIDISWWIFISAGVLALLIAFVTVSFQAIKAAIANPVKSLRTE